MFSPDDLILLKQLPIVGLFLLVVFKMQKEHQTYLAKRDEEHSKAVELMANALRVMSDRVYVIGLAFVALASEGDSKAAAAAAKKIMEDMTRHDGRMHGAGAMGD